jgi:hypothetical protein
MAHRLGKAPARPNSVQLALSTYLPKLPEPPHTFGHEKLVSSYPMLANDRIGCCVIAGGLHETQLWAAEGGKTVAVDDQAAIANYSAITGYNPEDPSTDQGTDMEAAAKYRRKVGLLDAHGKRHKIGAYLALNPGDIHQLYTAMWIFGAVGIGIEFPSSAMDQFNAGHVWDVVPGASIEGGHYVSAVARRGFIEVITWGQTVKVTPRFFQKYCDEAIVYLSPEMLTHGKTPEGFDLTALQNDLTQLGKS